MNPIRIALGIFLATLIAVPAYSQDQSAPLPPPSATQTDQAPRPVPPDQAPPAAPAAGESASDVPHPMRIRVAGNVQQANVIHMVQPVYPPITKTAHISGTVTVHIVIGTDGAVQSADVIAGPLLLRRASLEAAEQWRYRPTLLNGQPVEVDTQVLVVFALGASPETSVVGLQETPPQNQPDQAPAPATPDSNPPAGNVGGGLEQATLIHKVNPTYPKDAKDAHISGTIVLHGVIAKDGTLQQVEYVSGPEELKQAAIDAVNQWQYKPTTLAGKPIDVETTISLVFALKKTDEAEPTSGAPATNGNSNSASASQTGLPDALNGTGPPPPPPHNAPSRIRVGGAAQARSLVHQVQPTYPMYAKMQYITGTVVLHVILARDGSVQTVEVVSGPDDLVRSAVDAVKQWRYKPTLLNGQPVEVDTTVQVIFSM